MSHFSSPETQSRIRSGNFTDLVTDSIEAEALDIAHSVSCDFATYESLLLGTQQQPRRWYDWNVGFLVPHLNQEIICKVLSAHGSRLLRSEGVAWGLGETGSDDPRIVEYLYEICEACVDYDSWWCAADALEKIEQTDATDLKKRTLQGEQWTDIDYCLENLEERPAIIGVLRLATMENTASRIVPACRVALSSKVRKRIQNAVWLLERLRVSDADTLATLHHLYEEAEDFSHTLRPRIVEAFGEIAAPGTRALLEHALLHAKYFRTRAYAARGLGRIGDNRSTPALNRALNDELDNRVLPFVSEAVYSIQNAAKRKLSQVIRGSHWPENGMVVDESNYWYGNPEVYEEFSEAEDPLGLSLMCALAYVPVGADLVVDIGAGTGRLTLLADEMRPDIGKIVAFDISQQMMAHLRSRIKFSPIQSEHVSPVRGRMIELPIRSNSVDVILSSWAFPSKMWNKSTVTRELAEVYRVLKEDGLLITVGWDESFRDELSEVWYRFVPEPDFRRETFEQWRKRRTAKIGSPRNCHLTFVKKNLLVPLLFESADKAARVMGYLFGRSAGNWVARQQRCEFSIRVGITCNSRTSIRGALEQLAKTEES